MKSVPYVSATLIALAFTTGAEAQNADAATAQALFEQGKALMQAGQLASACPKLAESQRLDPGTGTLLALALCHEKEGKLASAWVEFTEVLSRVRREGRKDRETLANDHVTSLRKRLSTIVVDVPPAVASTPGLEIKRDNSVIGRSTWGVAVPIDFGTYTFRATAPGYTPWETKVFVKTEHDEARVVVAPLVVDNTAAEEPKVAPAVATPAPREQAKPPREPKAAPATQGRAWDGVEWTGVITTAMGGAALAVSGYYLVSALSHRQSSVGFCYADDSCEERGILERRTAYARGNTATAFSITGGGLVVVGVVTYILGRSRDSEPSWSASIRGEPGGASATFSGAF